jgi:hypothetical protein
MANHLFGIVFGGTHGLRAAASLNHFDDLVSYRINEKYQIIHDRISIFRWDFEFWWDFIKLYSYGRQDRTRRNRFAKTVGRSPVFTHRIFSEMGTLIRAYKTWTAARSGPRNLTRWSRYLASPFSSAASFLRLRSQGQSERSDERYSCTKFLQDSHNIPPDVHELSKRLQLN